MADFLTELKRLLDGRPATMLMALLLDKAHAIMELVEAVDAFERADAALKSCIHGSVSLDECYPEITYVTKAKENLFAARKRLEES